MVDIETLYSSVKILKQTAYIADNVRTESCVASKTHKQQKPSSVGCITVYRENCTSSFSDAELYRLCCHTKTWHISNNLPEEARKIRDRERTGFHGKRWGGSISYRNAKKGWYFWVASREVPLAVCVNNCVNFTYYISIHFLSLLFFFWGGGTLLLAII